MAARALAVVAVAALVGKEGEAAPGATVSLPREEAEALIARGFARPASAAAQVSKAE